MLPDAVKNFQNSTGFQNETRLVQNSSCLWGCFVCFTEINRRKSGMWYQTDAPETK